jgi:hypothetical protein
MLELYMEVSMVGIHWIMIWTDIQLTSKPDTGKSLVGYTVMPGKAHTDSIGKENLR